MDSITRQNCKVLLAAFIEKNDLNAREIAKAIPCPEATISRILAGGSLPTDNMLAEVGIMIEIGFERYLNLSKSGKKKILEAMGAVGGSAIGFSTITAAVGALGAVSGLSAAGVTTGLGALGAIAGGSMVAGISVAAAIPIAAGAAGYGVIKAAKSIIKKYKMDLVDLMRKIGDGPSQPVKINAKLFKERVEIYSIMRFSASKIAT